MNKLKITLIATASILALVSCGGGGGGTPKASSEIGSVTTVVDANLEPTSYAGTVNGDALTFEVGGAFLVNDKKPTTYLISGAGPLAFEDGLAMGTLYGTYLDDNGLAHSFAAIVNDASFIDRVEIRADTSTGITYSFDQVEYGFTSSTDGVIAEDAFGYDGVINVNVDTGVWNADFGDEIDLRGRIDGKDVSGTATWNGVVGEFAGYDGNLFYNGELDSFTTGGAFAGADANDTFAGGWHYIGTDINVENN